MIQISPTGNVTIDSIPTKIFVLTHSGKAFISVVDDDNSILPVTSMSDDRQAIDDYVRSLQWDLTH